MIIFSKDNNSAPYARFKEFYLKAENSKQNNIEAICISSYDSNRNEVDTRFVNLKYICNDEWTFFTNYSSPKASQFNTHNQISCAFFWSKINVQIRIKANIRKTSKTFSDNHFKNRELDKNILAISSHQSKKIGSFEEINTKFNILKKNNQIDFFERPSYWGGFSFKPYYFEFWVGHKYRLNYRESYELINRSWEKSILEP